APVGVSATPGNGQVEISWAVVSGAASYNIYWSTSGGLGTAGTKITGASNPYDHMALANGTSYYYVVTALNSAGESPASSEVIGQASAPAANGHWGYYTEVVTDGINQTCYDTASLSISQSALTFTGTANQTGQCHTGAVIVQNNGSSTITN